MMKINSKTTTATDLSHDVRPMTITIAPIPANAEELEFMLCFPGGGSSREARASSADVLAALEDLFDSVDSTDVNYMIAWNYRVGKVSTYASYPTPLELAELTEELAQGLTSALCNQFNGAQGEVTNKDDVKKGAVKAASRRRPQTANVNRNIVSGSGAYDLKQVSRAVGNAAKAGMRAGLKTAAGYAPGMARNVVQSAALAAGVPAPFAATLGNIGGKVGTALRNIVVGHGDYLSLPSQHVTTNSFMLDKRVGSNPRFAGDGSRRIQHVESLGLITSGPASTFTINTSGSFNPSSPSYPWLTQQGAAYLEFQLLGMLVIWKPMITPGSALTGSIAITCTPNTNTPAPTTQIQFENLNGAVMERIDHAVIYPVECAPGTMAMQRYYTRQFGATQTNDVLYPVTWYVGTNTSLSTGTILGELFIAYDVLLETPALTAQSRNGYAHIYGTTGSSSNPYGSITTTLAAMGTLSSIRVSGNSLLVDGLLPGDGVFLAIRFQGSSTTLVAPTITTTNGTLINVLNNRGANWTLSPAGGSTVNECLLQMYISFSGNVGSTLSLTLASSTLPFTATEVMAYQSVYALPSTSL
jgi:hypothetical protein